MNAPLYRFGVFGDEVSLIVAFVIGIAFGFFLEQAGFGSARKLTAQFYFKDLAVLKVMFTAIVTAMVGLYLVSRAGLMDLSLVHLTPTFVVPQIIGGVLLGVGFVIGGYCPGTSVVSAATGRLDAIVFLAGMGAGVFAFGELNPVVDRLAGMTPLGAITVPARIGVSHGVVVLGAVLVALTAFVAAEWAEKRWGAVQHGPGALTVGMPRFNAARVLAVALVGFGVFAAMGGSPYRAAGDGRHAPQLVCAPENGGGRVTPSELATWIIEGRADYTLMDVRAAEEFSSGTIPGAMHVPLADFATTPIASGTKVVVVAQDDAAGREACAAARAQGASHVYVLAGGFPAWESIILHPSPAFDESAEAREDLARRESVARYFSGESLNEKDGGAPNDSRAITPASRSEATTPRPPPPPKKKKREGC